MSAICCLSGKKRSGKNTAANYIMGKYLVKTNQISDFTITNDGLLKCKLKLNGNSEWITIEEWEFDSLEFRGIKRYSFADPLKEFCMDVFGLTYEQCYGTEEEKNSRTNIRWSDVPGYTENEGTCVTEFDPFMTARELLQYFGTNVVRKMYSDAWVEATMAKINRDSPELAMITDARFPNEIDGIMNAGGTTIRLLRNVAGKDDHPSEIALDDFPCERYSFVIDNRTQTIDEQCKSLDPVIDKLFEKISRR